MRFGAITLLAVLAFLPGTIKAQAPYRANASEVAQKQLMAGWRHRSPEGQDVACVYAHMDSSRVEIDSIGPSMHDASQCLLGAQGAWRYVDEKGGDLAMREMAKILVTHPQWMIVGQVYAIQKMGVEEDAQVVPRCEWAVWGPPAKPATT